MKPPPPPDVEKLRGIASSGKIDPTKTYRIDVGGGKVLSFTGLELLATAEAAVAVVDAIHSGDDTAAKAALNRMYET